MQTAATAAGGRGADDGGRGVGCIADSQRRTGDHTFAQNVAGEKMLASMLAQQAGERGFALTAG